MTLPTDELRTLAAQCRMLSIGMEGDRIRSSNVSSMLSRTADMLDALTSTQETSAPDRIWADQDNLTWVELDPSEAKRACEVEYVRADVVGEMAELLDTAVSQLMATSAFAYGRGIPLLYQETASKARAALARAKGEQDG